MTEVAYKLAELQEAPVEVQYSPETLTLLDLVAAVADASDTEEEVVATIQHLVESGKVTLVGNFRGGDVSPRRPRS